MNLPHLKMGGPKFEDNHDEKACWVDVQNPPEKHEKRRETHESGAMHAETCSKHHRNA